MMKRKAEWLQFRDKPERLFSVLLPESFERMVRRLAARLYRLHTSCPFGTHNLGFSRGPYMSCSESSEHVNGVTL